MDYERRYSYSSFLLTEEVREEISLMKLLISRLLVEIKSGIIGKISLKDLLK